MKTMNLYWSRNESVCRSYKHNNGIFYFLLNKSYKTKLLSINQLIWTKSAFLKQENLCQMKNYISAKNMKHQKPEGHND